MTIKTKFNPQIFLLLLVNIANSSGLSCRYHSRFTHFICATFIDVDNRSKIIDYNNIDYQFNNNNKYQYYNINYYNHNDDNDHDNNYRYAKKYVNGLLAEIL